MHYHSYWNLNRCCWCNFIMLLQIYTKCKQLENVPHFFECSNASLAETLIVLNWNSGFVLCFRFFISYLHLAAISKRSGLIVFVSMNSFKNLQERKEAQSAIRGSLNIFVLYCKRLYKTSYKSVFLTKLLSKVLSLFWSFGVSNRPSFQSLADADCGVVISCNLSCDTSHDVSWSHHRHHRQGSSP